MARGTLVDVVVFDQNLYRPGGMVAVWMRKITNRFEENAIRLAPMRTGVLRAGIHASTRRVGLKQYEGQITSYAPHTMFVLDGTAGAGRGRIEPMFAKRLRLPAYGPYPTIYAKSVRGQKPNNFLLKAWRATGRQGHKSIRGRLPNF